MLPSRTHFRSLCLAANGPQQIRKTGASPCSLNNAVSPLTSAVLLVSCVMRMVPEVCTKPSVSPCGCHAAAVHTTRLVPTSRFHVETQHRACSPCFVFGARNADNQIEVAEKLKKKHGAREGANGTAASSLFPSCVMLLYQNAPAHSVIYKWRTE